MSTLWQRFGRGARDPARRAIALFLVEPKHFDDEKEKRIAARERRQRRMCAKRKLREPPAKPNKKRLHVIDDEGGLEDAEDGDHVSGGATQPGESSGSDNELDNLSGADEEADPYAERRLLYHQDAVTTSSARPKAFKTNVDDMEPAMNDFINPSSAGYSCFRTAVDVFFGNDKLRTSLACR